MKKDSCNSNNSGHIGRSSHISDSRRLIDILSDKSRESAKIIRRVVIIGCIVNALLMFLKLGAGYFGHSEALVADGFHSLNDLAADIIMLIFVGISYRDADDKYNYGYGKFETFSSFIISMLLVIIACTIAFEAVESILDYIQGEELEQPDIWTVVAILIAKCCKEGLFRFYSHNGKKENSMALVANAWHHRSDAMASVATLIGVTFSHFFGPAFRVLDPVASLVIACFILVPAVKLFLRAFFEFMERSLTDPELKKAEEAIRSVEGVDDIYYLRTRRMGHQLMFDIGITTDPNLSIKDGTRISRQIEAKLVQTFCPHIMLTVACNPPE